MNFLIKVVLSSILMVQFCFGETALVYQKPRVKNAIGYIGSQPTFEDVAKFVALSRLDASVLVSLRKILKDKGVRGKQQTPFVTLEGNKIKVDGLKHPLIIGNSATLSLSYDGEQIQLKNVKDVEQVYKDVEQFFAAKVVSVRAKDFSVAQILFRKLVLGDEAQAVPLVLIGILITMLIAVIGVAAIMPSRNKDDSWKNEWMLDVDNIGKDIDFKCQDSKLVMINGKEQISFSTDETAVVNGRKDASGNDISIFRGMVVSYYSTAGKERSGQLVFDMDRQQEVAQSSGRFANSYYTPARIESLRATATVVLGEDGKRKICNGNDFADNLGSVYKDLAKQYTKLSKEKDSTLPTKVKQLDSGRQTR